MPLTSKITGLTLAAVAFLAACGGPPASDGGTTHGSDGGALSGPADAGAADGGHEAHEPPQRAPEGVSAVAAGGAITLVWGEVEGAGAYRIYVDTSPGVGPSTATLIEGVTSPFVHAALPPATALYYVVAAVNAWGEGPPSAEVTATTASLDAPPPPANIVASGADARVAVTWDAALGATSYEVHYAATSGVLVGAAQSAVVYGTRFDHLGLQNGAAWHYVVTSRGAGGMSAPSGEVSATPSAGPVAGPSSALALAGEGEVELRWTLVPDATSYTVYWGTSPELSVASAAAVPDVSSPWLHAGLPGETAHFYLVTALVDGVETAPSPLAGATTLRPFPRDVSATAVNGAIVVDWGAVVGADGYTVYASTEAGIVPSVPSRAGVTAAPPFVFDDELVDGNTYYFRVTAELPSGESKPSVEVSCVAEVTAPAEAPQGLSAVAGASVVELSWQPVLGASSYVLYWDTAAGVDGGAAAIPGVTGTSYLHAGVVDGVSYFYRVAAANGGGVGPLSAEASAVASVTPPPAPGGLSAEPGAGSVRLSWSPVLGATGYALYWATEAGVTPASGQRVDVGSPPYTHTGLANASEHFYVVVALNSAGEGAPSAEVSATPARAPVELAAGVAHTLLRSSDGTVWAFGASWIPLGGADLEEPRPLRVFLEDLTTPLAGVRDVHAGGPFGAALLEDGRVMAWGRNGDGQLGVGDTSTRDHPSLVRWPDDSPLTGVASAALGYDHLLLLLEDGTVHSIGSGEEGQLGNGEWGSGVRRLHPGPVLLPGDVPLSGATAVGAGRFRSIALLADGTVWTWGVGLTFLDPMVTRPSQVLFGDGAPLTGVVAIHAGGSHFGALRDDGTLWTWGKGSNGQLGDGSGADQAAPVQVQKESGEPLVDVRQLSASYHTLVQLTDGTVWGWGLNWAGAVGDGTTEDAFRAKQLFVGGAPLTGVRALGAGGDQSVLVLDDGTVLAWGYNETGELPFAATDTCSGSPCNLTPGVVTEP